MVRRLAADRLVYFGVTIGDDRNESGPDDRDISGDQAGVHTLVIAAREDLQMARESRALLADD
jgi:acetate kinase